MFKYLSLLILGLTLFNTDAQAQAPLKVMYIEIDEGRQLMDRDRRVFQRIFNQTGEALQDEDIRLFEAPDIEGRSYKKAMRQIKRLDDDRLDAYVMVGVKHIKEHKNNRITDRIVAVARIIDGQDYEVIDTVRISSPKARLREGQCGQGCRKLIMARHVQEVLPDFKEEVSALVADLDPRQKKVAQKARKFTLTLKGFDRREVRFIENKIVRLSGTRDLSSLTSHPDKPAFWLEREKGAANVRDDLSDVLSALDLQARIIQTPRQITLIKVNDDVAYLD